jgi:outer membrane protein OmpA-like peptidoglycan-associated protein
MMQAGAFFKRSVAAAYAALLGIPFAPGSAIPPVPMPVGTVFFDSLSVELSQNAKTALRVYRLTIRSFGGACHTVRVVGHLDRSEAKAGNPNLLDRRRALIVKDALHDLGLVDVTFEIFGRGVEQLLLPDAPDVEPQNRRVEIIWSCESR